MRSNPYTQLGLKKLNSERDTNLSRFTPESKKNKIKKEAPRGEFLHLHIPERLPGQHCSKHQPWAKKKKKKL